MIKVDGLNNTNNTIGYNTKHTNNTLNNTTNNVADETTNLNSTKEEVSAKLDEQALQTDFQEPPAAPATAEDVIA